MKSATTVHSRRSVAIRAGFQSQLHDCVACVTGADGEGTLPPFAGTSPVGTSDIDFMLNMTLRSGVDLGGHRRRREGAVERMKA